MESIKDFLENNEQCRQLIERIVSGYEREIAKDEARIKQKYKNLEGQDETTRAICEIAIEVSESDDLAAKYKSLKYFKSLLTEPKEGNITDQDIEEAKRTPLDQISGLEFRNAGTNRKKARCPFHDERTPSFMYYTDQNSWHCYSCNEGGDVISYLMKTRNLPFISAVKQLIGA